MKKCPYCAEEIQDNAVKCKHCGESLVAAKGSKTSRPSGLAGFVAVVVLSLTVAGCYAMYRLTSSVPNSNPLQLTGLFAIAGPLGWILGDLFRRIAHPTMVFGRGAMDLFGQRIFWWVGPQLFGMAIAFGGILYYFKLLGKVHW